MSLRPSATLLKLALVWFALGLAAGFWPVLAPAFIPVCGLLFAAALMDGLRVRQTPVPRLERELSHNLPIAQWQNVELCLHHGGDSDLTLDVFDHVPDSFSFEALPLSGTVPARGFLRLSFRVRPDKRGNAHFPGADVRLASPFGLWRRQVFINAPTSVRVYPNFAAVSRFAQLALESREGQMGVLRRQRRGEGLDFHQLREYREGDALRQIDWKASSRHKKMIAREYQEERDQQIVFLLDCGRRLRGEDGELKHFDEALNAMLLLSYVALRQGDAVGLMSFAGPTRFRPPRKGLSVVNELLNATYDLEPGLEPSDYAQGVRALEARLPKRALVVLLTALRDDDSSELVPAVQLLRRRHLVLVADLREQALDTLSQNPPEDFQQALRDGAGRELLALRKGLHERLGHASVHVLDTTPAQLPIRLVNRYLDIKASGML